MQISREESAILLARLLNGELPDARGRFGPFGGRYAPETLMPALERASPAKESMVDYRVTARTAGLSDDVFVDDIQTSPMADTPGTLVRKSESTTM